MINVSCLGAIINGKNYKEITSHAKCRAKDHTTLKTPKRSAEKLSIEVLFGRDVKHSLSCQLLLPATSFHICISRGCNNITMLTNDEAQ